MSDDHPSAADPFGPIADEFVEAFRSFRLATRHRRRRSCHFATRPGAWHDGASVINYFAQ
jgi:hypothetical protein